MGVSAVLVGMAAAAAPDDAAAVVSGDAASVAPDDETARQLALELLEQAHSGAPSVDWLTANVRPRGVARVPGAAWYARLAASLGPDGVLGDAMRRSEGIVAVVSGPDYQRVLLGKNPRLSVVVYAGGIDSIAVTECGLCSEQSRFVRDLLADVQKNGALAHRLLPGVELLVGPAGDGDVFVGGDSEWVALFQARSHQGGELAHWLAGAAVEGADGDVVRVSYADGRQDTWKVVWASDHWAVDYNGFAPDSPLRLDDSQLPAWRGIGRLQRSALANWRPDWKEEGAGVRIGDRAIGAHVDPRDDTVLVVVADLDRVLSGLVRVDPFGRTVLARSPLPGADPRTNLPYGRWYASWPTSLSPDGTALWVSGPSRLWRVTVDTGRVETVQGGGRVRSVAAGADGSVVIGRERSLTRIDPAGSFEWPLADVPVSVGGNPVSTWAVLASGALALADREDGSVREVASCDAGSPGAAGHPDGAQWLVACMSVSGEAAARVRSEPDSVTTIEGTGSDAAGVSWSPDGRWFTTGAQGEQVGMLLWDALDETPVAAFHARPVHLVSWTTRADALAVTDEAGEVWWYEVENLLTERALR